jgi:predicted lipoprotein
MNILRVHFILILILLAACSTAPAEVEEANDGFDRKAMLANITNQLILPGHANFLKTLNGLETTANTFTANPNPDTLTALQESWLNANLARMAILPYRLGPVDDSLLHNRLDKRPPRTPFINETILAGDDPLTDEYLDSIGSTSVGLAAMEYLLFNPEEGNDAILAAFADTETGQRRLDYLLALAQNMPPKAEALQQLWAADGDNYAQAFIEAGMDDGELQGSVNMLVNQMIADLEEIISSRLGKPSGKRSNGMARPDLAEAPYSQASLPRIIATVEGLQVTFNGGDGLGLDDYLDFLEAEYEDEPLSQAMNAQFDRSLAALAEIEGTLETAVIDHPEQIDAAYEELRTLLVLLKVDLPNHLGLTLTFNDNDGD